VHHRTFIWVLGYLAVIGFGVSPSPYMAQLISNASEAGHIWACAVGRWACAPCPCNRTSRPTYQPNERAPRAARLRSGGTHTTISIINALHADRCVCVVNA